MIMPLMAPTIETNFISTSKNALFTPDAVHESTNYLDRHTDTKMSLKRDHDSYMSDDSSTSKQNADVEERCEKKPGRRPIIGEFEEDDEDPKTKRKVQNRAAQRAFRERKEKYVKDLEKKVKYVQDSHVCATTKLHNENQQLRAIVFQLELQLVALTGVQLELADKPDTQLVQKKPGQSWLTALGPSVPLSTINSFPSNPLPPLQIRPSTPMNNCRASKKSKSSISKDKQEPSINQPTVNTNQQQHRTHVRQSLKNKDENQKITFAISTPATLRAHNEHDISKKNGTIQTVQLYPNHSHPANSLLERTTKDHSTTTTSDDSATLSPILNYTSSANSSCNSVLSCGGDEDDEEDRTSDKFSFDQDMLVFNNITEEGLHEVFKPFFDQSSNKFYMTI